MELFYAYEVDGQECRLDAEESAHCVRVLRHRSGDTIHVIDGEGTLFTCRLTDANGKSQGTVTYRQSQNETMYYCAEVVFSQELRAVTGISCLRYILYDRWPEEGNGFLKDILDSIKG